VAKKKAIVKRASEQTADIPTRRARGRVRAGKALFPVPASATSMPPDYAEVLAKLKQRIAGAQTRASLSINRELVALYWHVGATIAHRQTQSDWGDSVVERLAFDVRKAFPGIEGFSPRNIWRMRAFFFAWSEGKLTQAVSEKPLSARAAVKLPQAVSEIPWGHNILIMQQLENYEERLWYAEQTRANGWSRAVLQAQLASNAHGRQGKATTNFVRALAKRQSIS
jgi:predicted nuclease of restriction endonuclease-like (RecB) superfamily